MKRRIGSTLTALSLVLCAAAVLGWVRSHMAETILIGSIPNALAIGGIDASDRFLNDQFSNHRQSRWNEEGP